MKTQSGQKYAISRLTATYPHEFLEERARRVAYGVGAPGVSDHRGLGTCAARAEQG